MEVYMKQREEQMRKMPTADILENLPSLHKGQLGLLGLFNNKKPKPFLHGKILTTKVHSPRSP